MIVRAGRTFHPKLNGAPSGQVGVLTLALEWPDNSLAIPPTPANIVESAPGSYTATMVAPEVAGEYVLVWELNGTSATESLTVDASGVLSAGLRYASPDDVRAYLGVTEEAMPDEELIRPIQQAQRDIDTACGNWRPYEDTGLKFATDQPVNYRVLNDNEARALAEATAAQVEYRLLMGDDFMTKEQYEAESGPDYTTQGTLRKVNGIVYTILQQAGLLRLHGRAGVKGYQGIPRAN